MDDAPFKLPPGPHNASEDDTSEIMNLARETTDEEEVEKTKQNEQKLDAPDALPEPESKNIIK